MYACTIIYVFMYNKVTYPNEITRRGPTWPLALNLCNTMYVHNHMLISNIDSTTLMLFDSFRPSTELRAT